MQKDGVKMGRVSQFFGRLFGSNKAIENIADSTAKGFDRLFFTSQEKAQMTALQASEMTNAFIEWFKNSQGQNLARRVIALNFVFLWSMSVVFATLLTVAAVWVPEPEKYLKSASILYENIVKIESFTELILLYYFAAPHMHKITGFFQNFGSKGKM